jgi:hypothetical protein
MMRHSPLMISFLLGLSACGPISPAPDYSIKVVPTADGNYAAVPPSCVRPSDTDLNFFDNQPLPQFGCANARNLALMVDRPQDLLQGRDSGPANGVTTAGSILRYNSNQTRGLVYLATTPDNSADATTASTSSSGLSGETPAAAPSSSTGK